MISIGSTFLTMIGLDSTEVDRLVREADGRDGLAVSAIFSFAGGGDRRGFLAFAQEPAPRKALLVGMSDRYNNGADIGEIRELCVADDGIAPRPPTADERREILTALGASTSPHALVIAAPLLKV